MLIAKANFEYGLSSNALTVGGPDAHVLEYHSMGGLHDNLDWLLSVERSHIALTLLVTSADGGIEGEVRGIRDVYASPAVVENLR